jgi:predicted ATPase
MARLDRLESAKEVAQIGAAIGREFSHALLAAVVSKPERELNSSLDRLITSGLLFRQGVPPHATYLFKHALVQDAAYGTLLRDARRGLHARIAETLEAQSPDTAETQPELLARHCTEAGLIEQAAKLWGRAGQRSLERSALAEAVGQFSRALDQLGGLAATPARLRQQVEAQIGLTNALMHTKGYAAAETKASLDRARSLIEQAQALGAAPEDPLLLFSVLYGFWVVNYITFNGDIACELAGQFMDLAAKDVATVPLMVAHRLMATSLSHTGKLVDGRAHYDKAIALYNPKEHRALAMRFGQDSGVTNLSLRSMILWVLGYPQAALADANNAVKLARQIGQATTLMYALCCTSITLFQSGNYETTATQLKELMALAEEKNATFWKALATVLQGSSLALSRKALEAVRIINHGAIALRSTGATLWSPLYLTYLAQAYAELRELEDSRRCIVQATTVIENSRENWCEAEVNRLAAEIALKSPKPDDKEAEIYFERALTVARKQQAKSWELRAAMSLARLWRDQGKPQQARELLAPVYGWFTEGFDTLDLKEAKALLDELATE